MKVDQFPIAYFVNGFSPKKMFLNRQDMKIWQMFLITIFLVFLMLNPVALNANKSPEFQLDSIMPHLMSDLEKVDVTQLNQIDIVNNQLAETKPTKLGEMIYLNETDENFDQVKTGLNFETTQLVMKDKNGLTFNLNITEDWQPQEWQDIESFKEWLTKEWNRQNAPYRVLSVTVLVALLILSSTLFLIFGASFFIWLTKKNNLSSIKTYKEALTVTFNALFLSTLIATISGFIHYDITLMLTIQSFGLAIMILLIFAKTKFNDGLAKNGKINLE